MKIWNRVESYDQLPMAVRAEVSSTLADWRSEANIKRAFGRAWISHCGAVYDLSRFRGVPRGGRPGAGPLPQARDVPGDTGDDPARVGAGEEGQRHGADAVEQLTSQSLGQALPDPG